jgi:hypothetical protein
MHPSSIVHGIVDWNIHNHVLLIELLDLLVLVLLRQEYVMCNQVHFAMDITRLFQCRFGQLHLRRVATLFQALLQFHGHVFTFLLFTTTSWHDGLQIRINTRPTAIVTRFDLSQFTIRSMRYALSAQCRVVTHGFFLFQSQYCPFLRVVS